MTKSIPYTNNIGQTLNPGDRVVAVTMRWKSASENVGEFVGVSESGNPQVRLPKMWRDNETYISTLFNGFVYKV